MQQITTKHLLKFLPVDDIVRQETLAQIDKFTPDQNFELSKLLWMMFYELLDVEAKYEFEKALVDVKDNKRELRKDLYKQIEHQVFMKFMRNLREEQEVEVIDKMRDRLKAMVMEKMKNKSLMS